MSLVNRKAGRPETIEPIRGNGSKFCIPSVFPQKNFGDLRLQTQERLGGG